MAYSFQPKQKFAKASGANLRVSTIATDVLCRAIRRKTLKRAKRLLTNLIEGRQTLEGKYYTHASRAVLELINSCEKNAEFLGLDSNRLMVHASSSMGAMLRRRRRKGAFGSNMKSTNLEIMLIERGKESKTKVPKKKVQTVRQHDGEKELTNAIEEVREKSEELKKKVHQDAEQAGA